MTKRKQNIFQRLSEIDAQQQRVIAARAKGRPLTRSQMNKRRNILSPNEFLLFFYALPVCGLFVLGLLQNMTYDRTAFLADLGQAIFQIFLVVCGLGVIGIAAMIYSIWYLAHVKTRRRRGQYYIAVAWPIVFIFWVIAVYL